jgi:hypothetical protein
VSIHKRWNGHEEHRSRLVNRCRAYFGIRAGILSAQDAHQGHFETQPNDPGNDTMQPSLP